MNKSKGNRVFMTAALLKSRVTATGSHFFERSSMRFFGDTMSNYKVAPYSVMVKRHDGELVECYMLRRVRPVKHGLREPAFFAMADYNRILGEIEA
jgi:hypothetical protein